MRHKNRHVVERVLAVFGFIALFVVPAVQAQDTTTVTPSQIEALEERIEALESELDKARADQEELQAEDEDRAREAAEQVLQESRPIKVGGAVRFQYSLEDYDDGNKDRGGDLDLDTFRLNVDGSIGDVILSAEYRFYQYMDVIHHAWVGYDFTDTLRGQAGIHQVPFGVLPFNSHNFFFSGNYYLGLEDDYDAGLKFTWAPEPFDIQLAYYINDEMGGIDGFVDNRSDRYSYDVVGFRNAEDGTFANPADSGAEIAESNTLNGRVAYNLAHGENGNSEVGVSLQWGDLHDDSDSVGDNWAAAIHLDGDYGPWNVMLQATRYEYDLDNDAERLAVGAYSFFDTIASEANTYTIGVARSVPVNFGPISNITFYNDYSLIGDKSADLEDTWMNVAGFSVAAGGIFAYFDFIRAKNQPFVGGTHDSTIDDDVQNRFNLNVGYYF